MARWPVTKTQKRRFHPPNNQTFQDPRSNNILAMTRTLLPPAELGSSIPPNIFHAVSVSLPTWQDNVDYEEGVPRVHNKMVCGYPRFFVHPEIKKLAARCEKKFAKPTESSMLFPSRRVAERCRSFINQYYQPSTDQSSPPRLAEFGILPSNPSDPRTPPASLHIVLFPSDALPVAKQFWQHVGDNVSSRFAEYCLRMLDANEHATGFTSTTPSPQPDSAAVDTATTPDVLVAPAPKRNLRYYQRTPSSTSVTPISTPPHRPSTEDCDFGALEREGLVYVEERYGRNLDLSFADQVKVALRRRLAGVWTEEGTEGPGAVKSERDVGEVSEKDVYLFPCGMSAISNAHRYIMAAVEAKGNERKSVCFGFPYIDTLKILQKFGSGCYFFGQGDDAALDELEQLLSGERILALFLEFPSNPLLKSADLRRLRALADQHGFFIVIDETLGSFLNVSVLEYADMVVSSLTKIFSGDSNVMGGSLVLNPNGPFVASLRRVMRDEYEDLLWCEDAIYLERNSRTFRERIARVNANAEALCDFLIAHKKVEAVYYPKYVTPDHYAAYKTPRGGYGALFSVLLRSERAATQFFDALPVAKGPSLGTNFTLASPYTILAHYTELDWAEKYGVSRHLVRVSVGLEEGPELIEAFRKALEAADE
ncbi:pyridoxal phosphate-dependent transferase [Endogone sp. FLAS-F59071]|nr:pyridoxal phosphate-dependent transferase [Endogone sp. FLAS-F59071]|eukprot:RUS18947.1 pyridoxal phosphate-dependent transferase [Endogone sp. FLAS-F59071]